LTEYPNLVVMHTLSKAWGLAALRLGMAFASEDIIAVFNKIKPPYNIGQATQELVLQALENVAEVNEFIRELVQSREEMVTSLKKVSVVEKIFPSDANFLLVKVNDARALYNYLLTKAIVVRDRSRVELCEGCLRITVGTKRENEQLIEALNNF